MIITYPILRIVTGPTEDAETLWDCNDASAPGVRTTTLEENYSLGTPELLGDPDALGVDWGLRQLQFTQKITGTRAAALTAQARLARVLLRARTWVMFQLDANTVPVWWHAYRSQPGALGFGQVYVDSSGEEVPSWYDGARPLPDRWRIEVKIDANAFGYLERIDLTPVTVGNTPGAFQIALPSIAGEALAPLRIGIKANGSGPGILGEVPRWLLAVVRGPAVVKTAPIGAGDGATSTGDDYAVGTGTGYAGGSYRQTSFPDTSLKAGPWIYLPGSGVPPGRYKALLRVGFVLTAQDSTFRAGLTDTKIVTEPLPSTSTAGVAEIFRVIDMGELAVGVTGLPCDVFAGTAPVIIQPVFGADTPGLVVRLDSVTYIRVDAGDDSVADTLAVTFDRGFYGSDNLVTTYFDGDEEVVWNVQQGGPDAYSARASMLNGTFPRLDPAQANTLIALPLSSASTQTMAIGTTHEVALSYQPQVLWLGDNPANEVDA